MNQLNVHFGFTVCPFTRKTNINIEGTHPQYWSKVTSTWHPTTELLQSLDVAWSEPGVIVYMFAFHEGRDLIWEWMKSLNEVCKQHAKLV